MSNFYKVHCDECEQRVPDIRCPVCDQQLCHECDQKVHNKGKRTEHQRIKIIQQNEQYSSNSLTQTNNQTLDQKECCKEQEPANLQNNQFQIQQKQQSSGHKQKKIQLNLKSPDYKMEIPITQETVNPIINNGIMFQPPEQLPQQVFQQNPPSTIISGLPPGMNLPPPQVSDLDMQYLQNDLQQLAFQEIFDDEPGMFSNQNTHQQPPQDPKIVEVALYQPVVSIDLLLQAVEITLREFAEKGDLMVPYPLMRNALIPKLSQTAVDIDLVIQQAFDVSHMTIRKFGESEPMFFVSLRLTTISLQSIVWIIQSIKKDLMTPTEKLIFSRIKECYGIKMTQYYWNCIMQYLQQLSDCNGFIDMSLLQQQNKLQQQQSLQNLHTQILPNLKLTKTMDPLNNNEFFIIKFIKEDWIAQDQGPLQQADYDNWITFIDFLKEFFRDDSKQMWISSVMNIHSNDPKKSQVKPPKSVNKAIPGGRYGCAQLLKCCGPQSLRGLSLGKLSFYVQEAITKGLLIYYKTLLIKGNLLDGANSQKLFVYEQEKLMKIKLVKDMIIEILKENRKGVSLARLPKLIQRRVNFVFDIQDLGFLKLKNMLKTIEGVFIENDGTTFACAYLQDGFLGFNFEQVLHDIREHIKLLSFQNPCGVKSQSLYYQLCVKINQRFNYQAFNQKSFDDFLLYYCEDVVDLNQMQGTFMVMPKRKCSIQIAGDRRLSGLKFLQNAQNSGQFDQQQENEHHKRTSIQLSWSSSSLAPSVPSLATTKYTDNEDMQKSLQFIEELLVESDDMKSSSKGNSKIWDDNMQMYPPQQAQMQNFIMTKTQSNFDNLEKKIQEQEESVDSCQSL